jgi:hypothetical protein
MRSRALSERQGIQYRLLFVANRIGAPPHRDDNVRGCALGCHPKGPAKHWRFPWRRNPPMCRALKWTTPTRVASVQLTNNILPAPQQSYYQSVNRENITLDTYHSINLCIQRWWFCNEALTQLMRQDYTVSKSNKTSLFYHACTQYRGLWALIIWANEYVGQTCTRPSSVHSSALPAFAHRRWCTRKKQNFRQFTSSVVLQ